MLRLFSYYFFIIIVVIFAELQLIEEIWFLAFQITSADLLFI